jgi:5-methylcytosine-specific restriction endonuclease McrA
MATDQKVLAEIDCFHRFYRFRQLRDDTAEQTRFEAWLDYKQAILRRDRHKCSRCGQVRPLAELDAQPSQALPGPDHVAPDNMVCVCIFCEESAGLIRPKRYSYLS